MANHRHHEQVAHAHQHNEAEDAMSSMGMAMGSHSMMDMSESDMSMPMSMSMSMVMSTMSASMMEMATAIAASGMEMASGNMEHMAHMTSMPDMSMSGMQMNDAPAQHNMHDMHNMHNMHGMHHGGMAMDGGASNGTDSGFMMMMFFHTRISDYLLFEPWLLLHAWQMVLACIGVFILAVFQEGLKALRQQLVANRVTVQRARNRRLSSERSLLNTASDMRTEIRLSYRQSLFTRNNIMQTVIYFIHVVLGYIVMLSLMSFSFWIFLSVTSGLATGFFLFNNIGNSVKPDIGDHCV